MPARLVEIFIPDAKLALAEAVVSRHCRRYWSQGLERASTRVTCFVQPRYLERLLDDLNAEFAALPGFTASVTAVDAIIPALPETSGTRLPTPHELRPPTRLEEFFSRDRVSAEEIFEDVEVSLQIRFTYLLTVVLSALIAALGMRSGQTAVVIGAMIIAPLLGPTMGLALAATVGNGQMARKAALTLFVGAIAALLFSYLLGLVIAIDPTVPELRNRSIVQPADFALALATGAAGVLAFTKGASLSLVGVMIAVSLVPPLAASGLFLAHGYISMGLGALYLFLTNMVSINVAGIVMFLVQGLPPKTWRITSGILVLWFLLLILIAGLIFGGLALRFT